MKKLNYITGVAGLNIFLAGAIFKVAHFPGANILITVGLGLFALVFIPLAVFESFKSEQQKGASLLYATGFICLFIDVIGAMFKIAHYPGAKILLVAGISLPFVVFLPVYLRYTHKNPAIPLKNFLGVMFLMLYIAIFSALLAVKAPVQAF